MGRGMMGGCGEQCARAMLFVFNIIFWLSGAAILGLGIWLLADPGILKVLRLVEISDGNKSLEYAAYVLIAIGAFVFVVGFLGCCGAIKLNKCMLGTYIVLLVIVMAGEIAAAVLAILYQDQIGEKLETGIETEMDKDEFIEGPDGDNKYTYTGFGAALLYAQAEFKCCGLRGPVDYLGGDKKLVDTTKWPSELDFKLLPTCCKLKNSDMKDAEPSKTWVEEHVEDMATCQKSVDNEQIHTAGCKDGLKQWYDSHSIIFIGVGIGIACLEIFGFIFAFCLCRNIEKD